MDNYAWYLQTNMPSKLRRWDMWKIVHRHQMHFPETIFCIWRVWFCPIRSTGYLTVTTCRNKWKEYRQTNVATFEYLQRLPKSMFVGEEKPAADINTSTLIKCHEIDVSGVTAWNAIDIKGVVPHDAIPLSSFSDSYEWPTTFYQQRYTLCIWCGINVFP